MYSRQASNSEFSCLCLLSAGITEVNHYTWVLVNLLVRYLNVHISEESRLQ
jgi:hypothetical protein